MSNGGGGVLPPGAGTGAAATVMDALFACALPIRLRCETRHDSACPMSALVGVYAVAVAPPIAVPSSCHCTDCGAGRLPPTVPPSQVVAWPATGAAVSDGWVANDVGSL